MYIGNKVPSLGAFLGTASMAIMLASSAANAFTEKVLHLFCSENRCADGHEPFGEVALDQAGNLYGTTFLGGSSVSYPFPGGGVVFQFIPKTDTYSVIYNFCSLADCSDGRNPMDVRLVIDTKGNLYGTTYEGGVISTGPGVVFELENTRSGWVEKVLYAFCSKQPKDCHDAGAPTSGLTYAGEASGQPYDGTSPLYGTTPFGGTNGSGTVYALMPKAGTKKWSENVLYSFCSQAHCADGEQPEAPLYIDDAGNFYGTTEIGGDAKAHGGTVFELSPNAGGYTETTLYSFCTQAKCTDGESPHANIVMDSSGNLLSTALTGGNKGDCVIFELSPDGSQWQFSVLENFTGANGKNPLGNLVLDADGNLFGATSRGGTPETKGTVFEFNGSIQTLYSFCPEHKCPDGKNPYAGVIEDSAGNLYGTTSDGGTHHGGTLYELSP